jgi:NAD(P)-dependent dehydrogenase (short-subunit alcohol dehydrogenase family)
LAATGELGVAISHLLCEKDYDIVVAVRDKDKADKLIGNLKSRYPNKAISYMHMDYSKPAAIDLSALNGIALDGVVVIPPRPAFSTTVGIPTKEEWDAVFALTYSSPLEVVRRLEPYMNKEGSVVIMSGITSEQYIPTYQNSNVIRLAWTGAIKNLMHQFSHKSIRVNAISPGTILTEFNKSKIQKRAESKGICFEEELKRSIANVPLKQYGQPMDVAKVAYFLLSDLASHVNGVNLPIDGGESLSY